MKRTIAPPNLDQIWFVDKWEMSHLTGLSPETLKRYRLNGFLVEGLHWVRLNQRNVRFCAPLVLDKIQNQNFPELHKKAIENYQSLLLSYQEKPKRR